MALKPWTIVTGDFVPTGGMDRANYALASFLARSGRPVELVSHRVAADLASIPGVTVREVAKPFGSYFLGSWPLARVGRKYGKITKDLGGCVVVNGGNCPIGDVNWVHYVHAAYRPEIASWPRRIKSRLQRRFDLHAERSCVRSARLVVCNSERTRHDVIEHLGVKPEQAVTIYLGIDAQRFRPVETADRIALRAQLAWPESSPVVVFIGALGDRRKGFATLFRAWETLCKGDGWDARLVVIGQGMEREVWESRAAESGIGDRVHFLGFRSDVPDILRASDLLVAPTHYEAYGLGVHEAICCGLPALVSASAGVAERYPAELTDLLLPDPNDDVDLVQRLQHWRNNLEKYRTRIRPFSDELRSYSWDDMAQDFLNAAQEL